MCNWVTMLYSRKLVEHCKPVIMGKKIIILKKKKPKIMSFTTAWMDLEFIALSEVKSERGK